MELRKRKAEEPEAVLPAILPWIPGLADALPSGCSGVHNIDVFCNSATSGYLTSGLLRHKIVSEVLHRDYVCRRLTIPSAASLFDLSRAVMCVVGLEGEEQLTGPLPGHNAGILIDKADRKGWCGQFTLLDCGINAEGKCRNGRIPGLRYSTKDSGLGVPVSELKRVRLAQVLDRPRRSTHYQSCEAGIRDELFMHVTLPNRYSYSHLCSGDGAFREPADDVVRRLRSATWWASQSCNRHEGFAFPPDVASHIFKLALRAEGVSQTCAYSFTLELAAVGAAHAQEPRIVPDGCSFQIQYSAPRVTYSTGSVYGGNAFEFEHMVDGADISQVDALNQRLLSMTNDNAALRAWHSVMRGFESQLSPKALQLWLRCPPLDLEDEDMDAHGAQPHAQSDSAHSEQSCPLVALTRLNQALVDAADQRRPITHGGQVYSHGYWA